MALADDALWALADVIPPELLGPLGLTAFLFIALLAMVRDHSKNDAKKEEAAAKVGVQLDVALAGWKTQTDANVALATEWRAANERRRRA
jgi:hypothetical protein